MSGYPELGDIVLIRGDSQIYAQVDDIERIRTPAGVEFRLQFRVNDAPLRRALKEQTGRIAVPISTDGQMRYEPPTLYYTLSTRNTDEENKRNLSDFVFSQWDNVTKSIYRLRENHDSEDRRSDAGSSG